MDTPGLKPETPKAPEAVGGNSAPQGGQMAAGGADQPGPQKASRLGDSIKDKAGSASETAKDIKSVAKAGSKPGINLKEDKADIKKAYDEKGAGAAAGEVGRKAAGKATQAAVDATGVGAPLGATAGKLVEKGLKKENLKKIAIGVAIFLSIPLIIIGIIVGVIMYAAANPFKFVQQVVSDPKTREFAIQAAKLVGTKIPVFSEDTYKKYGYVEVKPGQAIAAPVATVSPKPGSIEEKILKIDIKNARYQSAFTAPDCPYTYTTKDLIDPKTGKQTSAIDEVKNKSGEIVSRDSFLVNYCIIQSMPLYNMMVRTQKTRDVNAFSGTILNYADAKDSTNIKGKTPAEVSKYVYDKTYNRITSKDDDDPKTRMPDVDDYIARVRDKLANNQDPDSVQFDFGTGANTDEAIGKTLCAFTRGYLDDENIKKGILTRLNSGQRSGIKSNTLSSTRELGLLSNEELSPTFKQLDGWAASRAYSQNVYGTQNGTAIDPERLGNTSYGASYRSSLALLYKIKDICNKPGNLRDSPGDTAVVVALYDALRQLIVDQSNGKFTSIDGFGLDQLMVGVIRMGGGSAVSGLEAGTQNFNNQSQGFRTLSNQYMMRMGGRFLTKAEGTELNIATENTRREIENKNGLAYRLFAEDNIRSLANIIRYETPRTTGELGRKGKDYIASLSNPIKLLADLSSGFSQIVLGKSTVAYAAGKTGDAYMRIDTIGLPTNEFDNTDPIANSDYVQNLIANGTEKEKIVLGYFDKCSKANIPTRSIFTRLYDVEIKDDEAEVIGTKENLIPINGEISYPAINNNFTLLGFANRTEFVACEIYLMPESEHETARDYDAAKQKDLFGFKINELAKKYHLYLYANSMVDLMVELSSTEKTDSIYANGSGSDQPPAGSGTAGPVGDIGLSSDSVPCPAGTTDLGVANSKYTGSAKTEPGVLKIRLCQISEIPGAGNDASGAGTNSGAVVNSRVAGAWLALARQAKIDNITLTSNSSFRLADSCGGTGDGSSCAKPGGSPHQLGVAIDFGDMNLKGSSTVSCTGRARLPGNKGWDWLFKNAEKWGVEQYSYEAWHWDLMGGASRCNSSE